MTIKVQVSVTTDYFVEVEANSPEEAEQKVESMEYSEMACIDERIEIFALEG